MFDWPPKLPRPTMHKGRALLNLLDAEERNRISQQRDFEIPDWRTGDVLKLSIADSLSENNIKEWSGVCVGAKAKKNLRATATINFHLDGSNVQYGTPLFSPLLKNI